MHDRSHLLTEQRLPDSMSLDAMPLADAVALMNRQDALAVAAVGAEQANIVRAVELVVTAFRAGGAIILRSFHGAPERRLAAGDDALDHLRR